MWTIGDVVRKEDIEKKERSGRLCGTAGLKPEFPLVDAPMQRGDGKAQFSNKKARIISLL